MSESERERPPPRVIAIGGGKGGVGKSLIAANMAIAFAEKDDRVVLVDADLGAANQHTLFGIDRPTGGLQALLEHRVETLDESATATRLPNLRLVVGTGAVPNAANINHGQKQRLLRHIRKLPADIVIVDVGAGTGHNVVDFFDGADVHVVVATPQLTSIQNAYGFLKAAILRHFRRTAEETSQIERLEAAMTSRETERADEILARLDRTDTDFAATLREALASFDARLIGNQIVTMQELGIFQGVTRMVRDFLGIPLPMVGYLAQSRLMHDSVNRRVPLLWSSPQDDTARALRRIAERLLDPAPDRAPLPKPPSGRGVTVPGIGVVDNDVGSYLRRTARWPVNWSGDLRRDGDTTMVHIFDVSPGGIGVETPRPLTSGERWLLVIDEPHLQVEIPIVVRHVDADAPRAGLEFEQPSDLSTRILAAARAAAAGSVARRATSGTH